MKWLSALAIFLSALILPGAANAAEYGENYGFAAINDGAGPAEEAPAFPGTDAFWAGACQRADYTGVFGSLTASGGFGTRPTTIQAPTGASPTHVAVPAPDSPDHCIDVGAFASYKDVPNIWLPGHAPAWRLAPAAQAGAHPDGSTAFAWARGPDALGATAPLEGAVDNIVAELPPGFVANPRAVPECTGEQFRAKPLLCPPQTQVGVIRLYIEGAPFGGTNIGGYGYDTTYPVYNLEPRPGRAAELGFGYASGEAAVTVRLTGKVRTNGDYGVTAFTGQIPAALSPVAQTITIWGVPWAGENDIWRAKLGHFENTVCNKQAGTPSAKQYISPGGLVDLGSEDCRSHYEPAWGPIVPFVSQETDCNPAPSVRLLTDAFQFPGPFTAEGDPHLTAPTAANWKSYSSAQAAVTGCGKLPFDPSITLDPTGPGGAAVQSTDSPSGLDVELRIPQNNELPFDPPAQGAPQGEVEQYVSDAGDHWRSEDGLATAHLRDTTVTLPEGMTLNPAAADGQGACTLQEIGVTSTSSPTPPAIRFNNQPVACPDNSKVGEVVVETPLLAEADWPTGNVYLAKQGDNPFGSDFAIYIAVESPERGVIVKLAGRVTPDPTTGRLTTTVVENPELPFDTFSLRFKGGPRAPLATPTTCGTHTNVSSFASHAQPASPVAVNDPFSVTSSPAGGCPATPAERPLGLGFSAGSTEILAGAHSPFTLRLTRGDGNQELGNVEVTTPEGFAATLAGVASCPEASIAQATARTATGDGAKEQANPSCPEAARIGTTTIGAGAGSQPFYVKGNVYLAGPYKSAPLSLAFIVPAVAGPFDLGVQVVRAAVNVNPITAQITTSSDPIPQILRGVPLRLRDIRVDVDRPGFALNPTDCSEKLVSGKVTGSHGAVTEVSNRFQVAECARLGFKPQVNLRLFGGVTRAKYQGVRAVVRPRPGDANIAGAVVRFPKSAFVAQEHLQNICTRVQWAAEACPKNSVYGVAEAISPLLDEPLTGNVHLRSSSNPLPDLVADLRGPAHRPIRVEVAIATDSVKAGRAKGALRNTVQTAPDAPVSFFRLQVFGGKKALIVNSENVCRGRNLAQVSFRAHNGRRTSQAVPVRNAKCGKWRKAQKRKAAKRKGHGRRGQDNRDGGR